ncbi:MAG: hypothetical protein M1547_02995 [Gammaproteobacteria bacterium]|nr:hypothetical protein [Gammaproteobacteria bacterium]
MQLTLIPGPRLIRRDWEYDGSHGEGAYVDRDVTEDASRYLFGTVALDTEITLRDIFLLLDIDPLLQEIFARDWAKELLAEMLSGNVTTAPTIEYDPEGIEYLELYQIWSQDSFSGELQPIHRLDFHGVGFVLREDVVRNGRIDYRADERIKWGVSFISPLEMLYLPIRLNPEVILCEDNADSINNGKEIARMLNPGVTLGQVIDGVLWELSFHGSPASRDEESTKLKSLADEVHSGEGVTHRSADLFAGYRTTLASCFTDTAEYAPGDLYDTLQGVGDHDNAEAVLQEKLSSNIRLKPEFSGMTGMELRCYVRMNSDITF